MTVTVASAAGARSAPKAPWTARALTRVAKECASPPRADAPANPTRPMTSDVRLPQRSLSRPPRNSSDPKLSASAVISHWRLAAVKPRST